MMKELPSGRIILEKRKKKALHQPERLRVCEAGRFALLRTF